MRFERLELLLLAQLSDHLVGGAERVGAFGQLLDETRVAFEQLGELGLGQLPR